MYDIVLTTCPPWEPYNPSPGLGYIAAYLGKHGYRPYVYDLNCYLYHKSVDEDKYLWIFENSLYWNDPEKFPSLIDKFAYHIDTFLKEIISLGANICGISTAYTKELFTIELIRRLKAACPGMKIILGGPGSSCEGSRKIFEDYVSDLVDAFVIGEGEETLLEVVSAVKNYQSVYNIPGVLIYKDGKSNNFVPRPPIANLDKIPFPTYDEFNWEGKLQSVIPVFSRGCIANCTFCNVRSIWGGYRNRSPENIFEEIKYLVEVKKITKYQIYDSAINGDMKQLNGVCDLIINAGYHLDWRALAMPRKNTPPELFVKMKMAGCNCLEIGVESGSDKILKMMRKIYNSQVAERFIRHASLAGIKVVIFLIVGFPGEGEMEFNETVDFLKRNKDYIDVVSSINTFMILDGTHVQNNPGKYGVVLPPERGDMYWHTEDGNYYEYRRRRAKELASVASDLGIIFVKDNLIN